MSDINSTYQQMMQDSGVSADQQKRMWALAAILERWGMRPFDSINLIVRIVMEQPTPAELKQAAKLLGGLKPWPYIVPSDPVDVADVGWTIPVDRLLHVDRPDAPEGPSDAPGSTEGV